MNRQALLQVYQPRTISVASEGVSTDPESYVAALFTRGGTITSTDLEFNSFPGLAGLESAACAPRAASLAHSSIPRDASRPCASSRGVSAHPDTSPLHGSSLQRDRSVPDSALNPDYDYLLPPSLALIAPELLKDPSVTSDDLYHPTKQSLYDSDAESGAVTPGAAATPGQPPRQPLLAQLALHHGAHTLVNVPPPASTPSVASSAGYGSMTEPAGGLAALLRQSSLDARSDSISGSTVVVSPFDSLATQSMRSTHSAHSTASTDVYQPPPGPAPPSAIPEDQEVATEEVVQAAPVAAASARLAAARRSTAGSSQFTGTLTRSSQALSSNLGLSTTDAMLVDENIRGVLRQLDTFRERHKFLGKYVMLGREGRRRGGVPPWPLNPSCRVVRLATHSPHAHAGDAHVEACKCDPG